MEEKMQDYTKGMKNLIETEIPGIYNVPESEEYRMSRTDRKKKLSYTSILVKSKPNLEGFIHLNSFDMEVKAGGFKRTENPDCYHNPKLELLLYQPNSPENNESFIIYGKTKNILKYLKNSYPKEHLRLYNYLEHGFDTEWLKDILVTHGSPAYIKAYEDLTGIKLTSKEE